MLSITLDPLKWWKYLRNKVKIQEIWLEYAGAEIDERRKKLVVAFDLLFRIVNTSDKEAKEVRWAVSVKDQYQKLQDAKKCIIQSLVHREHLSQRAHLIHL